MKTIGTGRVGDGAGSKPALVGDFDAHAIGGYLAAYPHALFRVQPVAVLNGVDQGLFHGQLDAEDVVLAPVPGFELGEQFFQHLPADQRIAGNHMLASPDPVL